jgi:hypothetical protein
MHSFYLALHAPPPKKKARKIVWDGVCLCEECRQLGSLYIEGEGRTDSWKEMASNANNPWQGGQGSPSEKLSDMLFCF